MNTSNSNSRAVRAASSPPTWTSRAATLTDRSSPTSTPVGSAPGEARSGGVPDFGVAQQTVVGVVIDAAADVNPELWRREGVVPTGSILRRRQLVFSRADLAAVREYATRVEPLVRHDEPKSPPDCLRLRRAVEEEAS